ncbi:hypothetical protein B0H17DRAFT_1069413, partial [Mycena rosella]
VSAARSLASAIALKASGHNVLVLERESQLGGTVPVMIHVLSVPPNGCKVLFDWGLEAQIRANAAVSVGFAVYKYDGGKAPERDFLGMNNWSPELLNEARGEFVQFRLQDLLQILYDEAIKPSQESPNSRVTVLFGAEVVKVDCESYSVTLRSGDIHSGDAIIGADGARGVVRRTLLQETGVDPDSCDVPTGLALYGTVIPRALAIQHPDLASFYESPASTLELGSNRGAITSSVGTEGDIMLWVYTPSAIGASTQEPDAKLTDVLGSCDPQIEKLAALAAPATCVQIYDRHELYSWVSESGRVLVLGGAAHPFPPASIHTSSIAIEDGAFIGKIFSHTHNPDRIPEFMNAFEEHRRDRCYRIRDAEKDYISGLITLPDGEMQVVRDAAMRANTAAGRNLMDPNPDSEESTWQEIIGGARMMHEWWMAWGRLRGFAEQENA